MKTGGTPSLFFSFRLFLADFQAFAGASGYVALSLVLGGAVLEGVGLVLLVPLLGVVTGPSGQFDGWMVHVGPLFALLGAQSQIAKLAVLIGLLGAVMILRAAVLFARDVRLAKLQVGFVEYQRSRVVDRLASSPWEDVARLRHARITHLMSGDIQRIGSATNLLLRSLTSAALLISQCALAFWLSPLLASTVFAVLAVCAFASSSMLQRSRQFGIYTTNTNLELLDTTMQFLGGLKLAISQNAQASFADAFKGSLAKLTREQISFSRQFALASVAGATISFAVGATGVLVGVGVLHLEPAVLVTLLLIIGRMSAPAFQLQQGVHQIANLLPPYEKLSSLLSELTQAKAGQLIASSPIPSGMIEFVAVSYLHTGNGEAARGGGVRELSLQIPPACLIGVAGPSGSGKTTFADLLAGLYLPQRGQITIGGQPLSIEMLPSWRNRTSYVPQDTFLFHDSIRRNLAWENPYIMEDDMWQALALADADALVKRMPLGLDTVLGERGSLVSGGERQRIALARAVLRKPDLLILDEASSGIDLFAERTILKRLLRFNPLITIVLISHRSESLQICDHLIRFANGLILEDDGVLNADGPAAL